MPDYTYGPNYSAVIHRKPKKKTPAVPPITYGMRMAALGDSITQYGAANASSLLLYQANGSFEYLAAQTGNFNIDIWGSDVNTNPGWEGANNGVAGQTLTSIGQRASNVINILKPDVLFIQGGTNDNIGIGNYQATADAYTGMAQTAHNAGVKHVFIRSIWPKGATQRVASTTADQQRYNAALKAFCDANPSWCHFIDIWSLTTNADGTPITGVLQADDLHPTPYGSYLAAPAYLAAVRAVMDATKDQNYLHDNFWAGNIFPNGSFAGSTAATGTGMSGTMPTGWTPSGLTSTLITSSVISNPITGGQTWVLDITPPAGTGSETLTLTPVNFTPTANLWYKLWMEFETNGNGFPNIQTNAFGVVNVDNIITSTRTMTGSLPEACPTGRLYVQAPPLQARALSSSMPIKISIIKGTAPYQIKLHRVAFAPQTDPHVTWGVTTVPVNTVAPSVAVSTGAVGTPITVDPGTWTGLIDSAGVNGQIFKYAMYRDGIFVSNTYASGALSYTPVNADGGSTLTWTCAASNFAAGRSAPVAVTGSVAVSNPSWKVEYDFVNDTHKTAGVQDGNSLLNITGTRTTAGYDNKMTTLFAINTPRRTSAGLLIEPAYTFTSWPSLPDTAQASWTKGSLATVTAGAGATGPEGTIVSTRVVLPSSPQFVRNTTASQSSYESAVFVLKGTAGQIVDCNLTPANAATPNNTVRLTFTGGWDVVQIPAILAGNSNMQMNVISPADVSQGSVTFDVAYIGLSKLGSGAATDKAPAPFPTTSASATSGADAFSFTAPAGAASGVFTFDDGSKQTVTVTGGSTYNIPTTLSRRLIKSFKVI